MQQRGVDKDIIICYRMLMPFPPEQKEIRRLRAVAWNMANPERRKQNARLYYEVNKKQIAEAARKYHQTHKIDNRDNVAAFRQRNPWYDSWQAAKQRCTNPKNPAYRYYGAKGIKVLLSKSDMQFLWVRDNAAAMIQPSIDRTNPEGNYQLDNCRFMEKTDNSRKRGYDAWRKSLSPIDWDAISRKRAENTA